MARSTFIRLALLEKMGMKHDMDIPPGQPTEHEQLNDFLREFLGGDNVK
jgi:hypothetical protein